MSSDAKSVPVDCDGVELQVGDTVCDVEDWHYKVTKCSNGGRFIELDHFSIWYEARKFKKVKSRSLLTSLIQKLKSLFTKQVQQ